MYILVDTLELRQMHGCFEISTMLTLLFLVSGIAANAKIVHELRKNSKPAGTTFGILVS